MSATVKGGDRIGPALKAIIKKLTNAKTVQVGFMADATYPNGTSVPMVAAIQEFGAPARGIPPRPFFRTMIAQKSGEWPEGLLTQVKETGDAKKALAKMGVAIAGQLKQSIVDFDSPGLSPVTVMLRGMRKQKRYRNMPFGQLIKEAEARVAAGKTSYGASTKPLVDTGMMLKSIVSNVE